MGKTRKYVLRSERIVLFGLRLVGFDKALRMIREIVAEPEMGEVYEGVVRRITNFGAFVQILPNKDGLLHISEIAHQRLANVTDVLKEGDTIQVKVIGIDPEGKVARVWPKVKVEGHAGVDENERADELARQAVGRAR